MSTESESGELDREVDASMRMFEKSNVGPSSALTPIKPARVLVVLDGTEQDETSIAAAATLRERFNVESLILDARDQPQSEDGGDELAHLREDLAIARAGQVTGSRPILRAVGDSYDAILSAVKEHDVDLLIVPCPFGRSFEKIGTDSAGTVIDVLLSKCPKPMLVIRRADQLVGECLKSLRFIISNECEVQNRAAAWAFGLIEPAGSITLNLVVEKEQYQNLRSILKALHPEETIDEQKFADALTKTHHLLHGAMAKTATALSLSYSLQPQASEAAPPNALGNATKQLLVMPIEVDDRFTQGFVQDRIRRSPHPVLIVPGHVRIDQ
ncbi:Universal stress protein family protein [Rubripirellula obstinata]|uniref:Universal stress protein family protein n=1 Tax=Rubripirellula obstinata TaxID=406547 RepID=A0A5B1CLA3_9BACT|nr:universal stress protein [Rubripirellula obstinata]KAA1261848.1 Universal stress protein family protein [Rubripirellula obstinata]